MKPAAWTIVILSCIQAPAIACSCGPTPSVCHALAAADHIFSGMVLSIEPGEFARLRLRVQVEKVFKGNASDTLELYDDGMCDAPTAYVGARLLVYTKGDSSKPLPYRGCSRTRFLADAVEDFELLAKYTAQPAHVSVKLNVVKLKARQSGDWDPAGGVDVELTSGTSAIRRTTNSAGILDLSDLPSGRYKVRVHFAGYHHERSSMDLTVPPAGCESALVVLEPDFTVSGMVVDHDGQPAPGVTLELLPYSQDRHLCRETPRRATTDHEGRFRFSALRLEDYTLGINICSPPSEVQPYPANFYPGSDDRNAAVGIHPLLYSASGELIFKLPPPLEPLVLEVEVLRADRSRLPKGAEVFVFARSRPQDYSEELQVSPDNESGKARLELRKGARYFLYASGSIDGVEWYSKMLVMDGSDGSGRRTLHLALTEDEFEEMVWDLDESETVTPPTPI